MLAVGAADAVERSLNSPEVSERFEAAMTLPAIAPERAVAWAATTLQRTELTDDDRQTVSLLMSWSGRQGLELLAPYDGHTHPDMLEHVGAASEFPAAARELLFAPDKPCFSLATRSCRQLLQTLAVAYPEMFASAEDSAGTLPPIWQAAAVEAGAFTDAAALERWASIMSTAPADLVVESSQRLPVVSDWSAAVPVLATAIASNDIGDLERRQALQTIAFGAWSSSAAVQLLSTVPREELSEREKVTLAYALLAHGSGHEPVRWAQELITFATADTRDANLLASLVLWELDLGRDRILSAWESVESWTVARQILDAGSAADAIAATERVLDSTHPIMDALALRAGRSDEERQALIAAMPPEAPQTFWARLAARIGANDDALAARIAANPVTALDTLSARWMIANGQQAFVSQWVQSSADDPSPWVRSMALRAAIGAGIEVDRERLWQEISGAQSTRFLEDPTLRLNAAILLGELKNAEEWSRLRLLMENTVPGSPAATALALLAARNAQHCGTTNSP